MTKYGFLGMALCLTINLFAQPVPDRQIEVTIFTTENIPVHKATVSLLKTDSTVVGVDFTDASGKMQFKSLEAGKYILKVTNISYVSVFRDIDLSTVVSASEKIVLHSDIGLLKNVSVTSKKQPIQFLPDKTIVNVESSITSAGATV